MLCVNTRTRWSFNLRIRRETIRGLGENIFDLDPAKNLMPPVLSRTYHILLAELAWKRILSRLSIRATDNVLRRHNTPEELGLKKVELLQLFRVMAEGG